MSDVAGPERRGVATNLGTDPAATDESLEQRIIELCARGRAAHAAFALDEGAFAEHLGRCGAAVVTIGGNQAGSTGHRYVAYEHVAIDAVEYYWPAAAPPPVQSRLPPFSYRDLNAKPASISSRARSGLVVAALVVVAACAGTFAVFAADGGVQEPRDATAAPKVKGKGATKTATFVYEEAAGKQTMVVSFLPKHRISLTITRDRKDGCHWSKDLTARFDDVQGLGLPDGDDTQVEEYKVEPKQVTCPVFVDIEKDTMARAEITTSDCVSGGRVPEGSRARALEAPPGLGARLYEEGAGLEGAASLR